MSKDRWHSSIQVSVDLPHGTRLRDLRTFLLSERYTQEDDVISLLREDPIEVWQTDSVAGVFPHRDKEDLYFKPPYSALCTHVRLEYLLPWLPLEHADTFISAAVSLSDHFGSPMFYSGRRINRCELRAEISRLADDLISRLDIPGSEFLAMAIDQELPL